MSVEESCFSCRNSASASLPIRENIVRTAHWRVAHAFGTSIRGWLVAIPLRHFAALSELTPDEAAELGSLLRDASAVLRDVTGCVKTYVMLFAEAEGFSHAHFHIVPRMRDQPEELRGPRIFSALGLSPDRALTNEQMDDVSLALSAAWPKSRP